MKLASVISGQIANLFQKRGEVTPNDLIKALEREIVLKKTKERLVPNFYTIFLCEEDCYRLKAARLMRALYESVVRKVIREDCFMDGDLTIKIAKMNGGEAVIVVESAFVNEISTEQDTIDLENDVLSNTLIENSVSDDDDETIVADRTKIIRTMRVSTPRRVEYDFAVLSDKKNAEIVLGERQIYIGRKLNNDFVLDDESASRIHAYIAFERHRHVIHDAGSLNGTHVNKKSVNSRELRDGDKILIGRTVLTYKVL